MTAVRTLVLGGTGGEALMGGTVLATDRARRDPAWEPPFGLESAYRDS